MKILAISGWKKSGKDSLTDYLVGKYNADRVSFAGPLKDKVASDFTEVTRSHCDDQEFKEKPILNLPVEVRDGFGKHLAKFMFKEFRSEDGQIANFFCEELNEGVFYLDSVPLYKKLYHTHRSLCILEGSVKRSVKSSYWVEQAIKQIINYSTGELGIKVITDMRYKSEADQLKEVFGKELVTIRINRFSTSPSSDPSERDMDDYKFDYVIENKGTLTEFYAKIDAIVKNL